MEIARISNEHPPLLGDGTSLQQEIIEANLLEEPTSLYRNDSFNEQESLDENSDISKKQPPLDGNQPALLDEHSLDGKNAISREQTPPIGEGTSNSDEKQPIISSPRTFERKTNGVSHEEVVQALYSAWQRNRQAERDITLDYFTTKELCAMHLALENVSRGKEIFSKPHKITEALATVIAKELLSVPECVEQDMSINFHIKFSTTKNLLHANLLDNWFLIEDGEWFPARYTETIFEDSDEQPPTVSEFWLRQVELYDKAEGFFLNPKLQTLLPILLFFWPLSILAVGSKYMECPLGHHLSHILMILGSSGCVAIIYRLALLHLTSITRYSFKVFWKWKILRLIEFTFLIVFIVQAFHFFDINPIAELDTNQCSRNLYKATLILNYLSIPLVSAYVIAYSVIACVNLFDIWSWIFRHL